MMPFMTSILFADDNLFIDALSWGEGGLHTLCGLVLSVGRPLLP
jgi:hypothetical protein